MYISLIIIIICFQVKGNTCFNGHFCKASPHTITYPPSGPPPPMNKEHNIYIIPKKLQCIVISLYNPHPYSASGNIILAFSDRTDHPMILQFKLLYQRDTLISLIPILPPPPCFIQQVQCVKGEGGGGRLGKTPGSSDFSCQKFPMRSIKIPCELKKNNHANFSILNVLQKIPCEIKKIHSEIKKNFLSDKKKSAPRLPEYRAFSKSGGWGV